MVNGFPDAEIHEINGIKLKNPVIFAGFVGAGLVGTISVDYIINKIRYERNWFLAFETSSSINCVYARTSKTSF